MSRSTKGGMGTGGVIVIIAILIIIGAVWYFNSQPAEDAAMDDTMMTDDSMMKDDATLPQDLEGIHIMADGSVMLGNGDTVPDAVITADGMIKLPDGRVVQPVMDMRNGGSMEDMEGMKDDSTMKDDTMMEEGSDPEMVQ